MRLAQLLAADLAAHPGESGARLLPDAVDAFALRVLTARAAERTIDVQYYIWHSDATGQVLAHELLQAADRGVHVRVLLDDMDARSRDAALVALDRHARIEIRLFNPLASRSGILRTLLELFVRGSRLNHRMHNKAWIVDGQVAIVGGRNIGDEYFAASDAVNFIDMDVLLAGPAVRQAEAGFEVYWNNRVSVPIKQLRRIGRSKYRLRSLRSTLRDYARAIRESEYARQISASPTIEELLQGRLCLEWSSQIEVVMDDPHKADRDRRRRQLRPGVLESMRRAMESARLELLLMSPYFVPGATGVNALIMLTQRGKYVGVLTNSLAATDVAAVHSGYSRYRTKLLEGGVVLHELKGSAGGDDERSRMRLGSSRASLHTKAALVDRERLFVGSFNLDPRSALLNCEMGVWIRSEALAQQLRSIFATATASPVSFRVALDRHGRPYWIETVDGHTIVHHNDPHAGWGRRFVTWVLQILPIESQL